MRKLINGIICCLIIHLALPASSYGGWLPWGDNTLITIDDIKYSSDDYRSWWNNWREPEMVLPETPDSFIEWMLMAREAERMKLFESPEYKKKINTFLKARTLMYLKGEEIDGKINISDDDLWQRYKEAYVPRFHLNILFFNTREDADNLLKKFGPEPISDEQLAEIASSEDGSVLVKNEWSRIISIDAGWHDIINSLEKGKLSDPIDYKQGLVILRLQEKNDGDRDDFATLREEIYTKLRKKQAHELTLQLLKNLREKYHVQVDEERLQKLDINAADDTFTDQPIVVMDIGSVSEKQFMIEVRGMQKFRGDYASDDETYRYKEQVLEGIISQTLTTVEGMARGYEKKSPFKEVFEFYRQNRLIKVLKMTQFASQVKVTPDEIKVYYEEHLSQYSRPETVRIVSVEGTPEMINALWTEVAMGGDFRILAQKRFDRSLPVQEIPTDHLAPEVKGVVQKLTKGELSPVFTVNDHTTLVQLIERVPAQPQPLASVSDQIKGILYKDKMKQLRQEYIGKLLAGSSITVNSKEWEQLKMELGKEDAESKP